MFYEITLEDIARLTGLHLSTVKKQLKKAARDKEKGFDRNDFPAFVRWLYPRLVLATEENILPSVIWKTILKERSILGPARKAAKAARYSPPQVVANISYPSRSSVARPVNRPPSIPDDENRSQVFPAYEEVSQA